MASEIEQLPAREVEGHEPSNPLGADHPMRLMTRRAAGLESPPWDAEARRAVAELFDELAADWHTRNTPPRQAVVADALDRGAVGDPTGVAVEVGSGIGTYSVALAERFAGVVAVDLSLEMHRLASAGTASRVLADACELPLPDASADAVVLVNMMLFPGEVDRVLAPGGCVVWVNTSGVSTPIHLTTDEVAEALPGPWTGVASRSGIGLWSVLRRDSADGPGRVTRP